MYSGHLVLIVYVDVCDPEGITSLTPHLFKTLCFYIILNLGQYWVNFVSFPMHMIRTHPHVKETGHVQRITCALCVCVCV